MHDGVATLAGRIANNAKAYLGHKVPMLQLSQLMCKGLRGLDPTLLERYCCLGIGLLVCRQSRLGLAIGVFSSKGHFLRVCRLKDALYCCHWVSRCDLWVVDADLDGLLSFSLFVGPVVNLS